MGDSKDICTAITTGMEVEECFVKWRIKYFKYVLETEGLIEKQEFVLQAGQTLGCQTKWRFYLTYSESDDDDDRCIKIDYQLLDLPLGKCIYSNFYVLIKDKDGLEAKFNRRCEIFDVLKKQECTGYELNFQKGTPLELVDGCLILEIQIIICTELKPIAFLKALYSSKKQNSNSIDKLVADLEQLFDDADIGDVELQHVNGNFHACKGVLSVRNAELRKMISIDCQNCVRINLDDFSQKALRTVLRYLHFGKIPLDSFITWEEIIDVGRIAKKLNIQDLFTYCDAILADKCVMSNAENIYGAAKELELVKAKSEIGKYIKSYCYFLDDSVSSDETKVEKKATDTKTKGKPKKCDELKHFYHNYTRGESVTTGLRKEDRRVTWHVNSLNMVRQNLKLESQDSQAITIRASNTQWKFSLTTTSEKDENWIGINCKLLNSPSNTNYLHACFSLEFQMPKKSFNFKWESEMQKQETFMTGFVNSKVMKLSGEDSLQIKQNLEIKIYLEIFTAIESETLNTCNEFHSKFGKESKEKLQRDMEALSKCLSFGGCFSDIKLVSSSGSEFPAHKALLKARSDIFHIMFQSKMSEETTGVVTLSDMSDKGVSLLLHYIYTGQVDLEQVICLEDIGELIYIAEKYNLAELRMHGEDLLVDRCELANAKESLEIARKMGLAKAEEYIIEFVKTKTEAFGADEDQAYVDLFLSISSRNRK